MAATNEVTNEVACEPAELPPNASAQDVEAAAAKIEKGKVIAKDKFEKAMHKLLAISIEGYPRALRSTPARRNEILRKHHGNQDDAADDVKEQAADLREEGKTWMMGLVPILGLPSSILYPAWRAMRRCSLLAGIFGHDLTADETKAKILTVFAGLRGVVAGEYVLEKVVQALWVAVAGPVAGFIPVGTLASKFANVEGNVMAMVGHETFTEGRRVLSPDEYEPELDPEPTKDDYLSLAKDTTVYGLVLARGFGENAFDIAKDKQRREAAMASAASSGAAAARSTADTAVVLGKGAVAAATAPDAKDKAIGAANEAKDKAANAANAAKERAAALFGGSKK